MACPCKRLPRCGSLSAPVRYAHLCSEAPAADLLGALLQKERYTIAQRPA